MNAEKVLYEATKGGNSELVKKLIYKKSDLDWRNPQDGKQTATWIATAQNQEIILSLLLDFESNANIPNEFGQTPLYIGSALGLMNCIKLLVEHGGDVDIPSNDGETPLFIASARGQYETIKYLINVGADLDIENGLGQKAIDIAREVGDREAIRILSDYPFISQRLDNPDPDSPLSLCLDAFENELNIYDTFLFYKELPSYNHFKELDERFNDACQSFGLLVESVVHNQNRDLVFVEEMWNRLCEKGEPDLLGMKIGDISLLEFFVQNRILSHVISSWSYEITNSDKLIDILRGVFTSSSFHDTTTSIHLRQSSSRKKMGSKMKSAFASTQSLNEEDVEEYDGLDSELYSLLVLRLGDESTYNMKWEDSLTDSSVRGIPHKFWPQVITNLILNSPRSHGLVGQFLKEQGLVNWEEVDEFGEYTLYPNLLQLPRGQSSWAGLNGNLPLTSRDEQISSTKGKFCYALRVNPHVKSDTLLQPRIIQAIANSPFLEQLVDVPVIHNLFEFKWRSYGEQVTLILGIIYLIFLLTSTSMILWLSEGHSDHNEFVVGFIISSIIIILQILIELRQMYVLFMDGSSCLSGIKSLLVGYFGDFWNLLDMSVIILWIFSTQFITEAQDGKVDVRIERILFSITSKFLFMNELSFLF